MLYTFAIILVVLWLLGLITTFTLGGFLHLFLIIALVLLAVRLLQDNRARTANF